MNTLIREKRKLVFEDRWITPEIIRQIAAVVENEVGSNESGSFCIYSVDATDDSSYESQSSKIFSSGEIIDRKPISKVSMKFNTQRYDKNIEVQIVQSTHATSDNYIVVSGDDSTWVNGILSNLSEKLEFSEQAPAGRKWIGWGLVVLLVVFLISYFRLLFSLLKPPVPGAEVFVFVLGVPFALFFGTIKLHSYLMSLLPSVELQTGPNYLQVPLQKRNRLAWVSVVIIIPVVITVVYDVIKTTLHL